MSCCPAEETAHTGNVGCLWFDVTAQAAVLRMVHMYLCNHAASLYVCSQASSAGQLLRARSMT